MNKKIFFFTKEVLNQLRNISNKPFNFNLSDIEDTTEGKTLVDFVTYIPVERGLGIYYPSTVRNDLFDIETTSTINTSTEAISKWQREKLTFSRKKPKPIRFDCKTHLTLGKIPLEGLEDSEEAILKTVVDDFITIDKNTKNKKIGEILSKISKKNISQLDEIRSELNLFEDMENVLLVITQSLLNEITNKKDKQENYIFNYDKKTQTLSNFNANNTLVVSDELLGKKGEKIAYIGNLKHDIILFDYDKKTICKTTDQKTYIEHLLYASRFTVESTSNNGKLFILKQN